LHLCPRFSAQNAGSNNQQNRVSTASHGPPKT
jgi:hypothetical protein